ncbi:MAG: hypothetical protein ABIQ39_02695, partial [Ilumatobacteraceae bacterium]
MIAPTARRGATLAALVAAVAVFAGGCSTGGAIRPVTTVPPSAIATTVSPPVTSGPTVTIESTTSTVVDTSPSTVDVVDTTSSSTVETTPSSTADASPPNAAIVNLPVPQPAPANPNAAEAKIALGTIEIPKLNVSKPLFEGVTLTTLN